MTYNPNDLVIGPGRPNQAREAAHLIFDTDPALWRCLFLDDRRSALRFYEAEWRADESLFGHGLCTVATLGDRLMGIELGFGRRHIRALHENTGRAGVECLSPNVLEHYREYEGYLRYLSPSLPDDVYYLEFLSIAPQARGRGLGRRLLDDAFSRAREEGYTACHLDVSSDNLAVAFYLRMGMDILSESRVVPFEKCRVHSHYRMVKAL
jgi:GNAT superfamily N-acetyltransferase